MERGYGILYETIKKIVEVEPMPTLLEKWTADAVAKRETETGRDYILTVLQARFNTVPEEIEDAICRMIDPIALKSWAADAATCKTIGEFAESLRQ